MAKSLAFDTDRTELWRMLRESPREALDRGAASLLLHTFDGPVAQVLVCERSAVYVTTLYALLLLRRGHELEPLHEDLERQVAAAVRLLDHGWDGEAFGRDLAQLTDWGCLERQAEPLKIRGYKDVRRERYRYRLTEDAVSLLEWLELRASAAAEGRTRDSRDLLIDVLGAIKELSRVVRQWHAGERVEEAPRRALYLLGAIDEHVRSIGEELIGFRAAMVLFAARAYDLTTLHGILNGLERYVSVYLARIEALRDDIVERLSDLGAPRHTRAFTELRAALDAELGAAPALFRAASVLRDPLELLRAHLEFFRDGGQLGVLTARMDESARGVLRKMHRHLRELERRSARVEDLRARIAELACLAPGADEPSIRQFANALVGSAHGRFSTRQIPEGGARLAPPLPRRATAVAPARPPRPLALKRLAPEAARELRARRLADLAEWLRRDLLRGRDSVLLSEARLEDTAAPRRWLDVARALHLDRGRDLRRLKVALTLQPGSALIASAASHLLAPECLVSSTSPHSSAGGDER